MAFSRAAAEFPVSVMAYNMMPGDFRSRELELELRLDQNKDGKPPRRRPGDGYVILGMLGGMVIGAIIGYYARNIWLIAGLVIGGGILGSYVGSWLKLLVVRLKKAFRKEKLSGPFVDK